jgi:hypothetical protein
MRRPSARIVLANLSTHTATALYDNFEPGEARRIPCRLAFHYISKYVSWLTMVEIGIGVSSSRVPGAASPSARRSNVRTCIGRRVETKRMYASSRRSRQNTRAKKIGRVYRPLDNFLQEAAKKQATR